jgi:hypothetical protein
MSPSQKIKDLIKKSDKIYFTIKYNKNDFTEDIIMAKNNSGKTMAAYGLVVADVYKKKKKNKLNTKNIVYNQYQIGNMPNTPTLTSIYFLSTYNKDRTKMYGELQWSSNFISGSTSNNSAGGFPTIDVGEFMVNGNKGIYKDITKVIIDFTNDVRIAYLIGKY